MREDEAEQLDDLEVGFEDDDDEKDGLFVLRELWPMVWVYPKLVSLLFFSLLGHVAATVFLALSLEKLFDKAIPNGDVRQTVLVVAALLAVIGLAMGAALVQSKVVGKLSGAVVFDLQARLLEHLLSLPPARMARARSGDLLARFSTDLASVAAAVGVAGPYLLLYALVAVGCLLAIAAMDLRAALGTFALFGFGAVLSRPMAGFASSATRKLKDAESEVLVVASETLRSYTFISVFSLRGVFVRRFAAVAKVQRAAQAQAAYRLHAAEMAAEYGSMALVAIALGGGALLASHGAISAGALVAIFTLLVYLQESVYHIAAFAGELVECSGGLARILEFLSEPVESEEEGEKLTPLSESIRFKDLVVQYDNLTALRKVSFEIPRGQHVAIVGRSGSGKSTLLRLLMRSLDPHEGTLLWDGRDVTKASRRSLREKLGVVFQEPIIVGETVREAVRLGRPEASDADVEKALEAAALTGPKANLSAGADTPLGENGSGLSGGQKQRLALARALIREPSVLLLDEVSAALDPESERHILETIHSLPAGQTIISVTHRPLFAKGADRILLLDGGKLVEDGSHEELTARGGVYAQLYRHQTGFAEEAGRVKVTAEHLATIPMLSNCSLETLKTFAEAFAFREFESGATIIEEGARPEAFYILHRGKLDVQVGPKSVATLEDGDCFGEIGLLLDVPRTATVRTLTPVTCFRLGKEDFERLMESDKELEQALLQVVRTRSERKGLQHLG